MSGWLAPRLEQKIIKGEFNHRGKTHGACSNLKWILEVNLANLRCKPIKINSLNSNSTASAPY